MLIRGKLGKLLAIGIIAMGLLGGAPMSPKEIEELLAQVHQPKIAHVLREEHEEGETEEEEMEEDRAPKPGPLAATAARRARRR